MLRCAEGELQQARAAADAAAAWVEELRAEERKRFSRERLARREQEERERQQQRRLSQGGRGQAEQVCSSRQSRMMDEPTWLQEAGRDAAALRLQARVRLRAARLRTDRRASVEERAAVRLQGAARVRRARVWAAGERAAREEVATWAAERCEEAVLAVAIEAVEEAATRLQAAVRRWAARRQVEAMMVAAAGVTRPQAAAQRWAARRLAGRGRSKREQGQETSVGLVRREGERRREAQRNGEEGRRQIQARAADERACRREEQMVEERMQRAADTEIWGLMCCREADRLESAVRRLQGVASLEVRAVARARVEEIRRGARARRVQVSGDARHARVLQQIVNVRGEEELAAAVAEVSMLPQVEAAGLQGALEAKHAEFGAAQGVERRRRADGQCLEGPRGRTARGSDGSGAQAQASDRGISSQVAGRGPMAGVLEGTRRERWTAREGAGAWADGEGCRGGGAACAAHDVGAGIRSTEVATRWHGEELAAVAAAAAAARVRAAEWLAAERARASGRVEAEQANGAWRGRGGGQHRGRMAVGRGPRS